MTVTWLIEDSSIRKAVDVFAWAQSSAGAKLGINEPTSAMLQLFQSYMELLDTHHDNWTSQFVFEYRRSARVYAGTQEPTSGVALRFTV